MASSAFSEVLLHDSSFHNPTLILDDEHKCIQANEIFNEFVLNRNQIQRIRNTFLAELDQGLSAEEEERKKTSLSMFNTFVPSLHAVSREDIIGDYISLDIGSTNFRVIHTCLSADSADSSDVCYYDIPGAYRKNDSSNLFHFLAEKIEEFVGQVGLKFHKPDQILPLGFTFSFPFDQQAIDVGFLKTWTKNFDLPDVVNRDVAQYLQDCLDKRGNRFNVRVVAIINDSTGTLISGSYTDPDCAIGIIMGSGHNACYMENVDRIKRWGKWKAAYESFAEVMINTECGCFGDNGSIDFIANRFDQLVDQSSLFPGSFVFEKFFSGHFLGELLRFTLLECVDRKLLLNGIKSIRLEQHNSIKTKDISNILSDSSNDQCIQLLNRLDYETFTDDDLKLIRYACKRISVRAATILSATISALIERVKRKRTVVAIDGSLYKRHPNMHRLMTDFIGQLLPSGTHFELKLAEDGSGKGAGIVAALATRLSLFTHQ